mmetsp:Transcript_23491/g.32946  ORF Transcript_23491/g.32946 Transcript_23491/m.32946 type:complete len:587 (-) Transcript_23491:302-2062(-)
MAESPPSSPRRVLTEQGNREIGDGSLLFSTPTKLANSCSDLVSNAENELNGIQSPMHSPQNSMERTPKRSCQKATPLRGGHFSVDRRTLTAKNLKWNEQAADKNKSFDDSGSDDNSVAASSVVSVSQMRGWLNDFGQKNKEHAEKNTVGRKPEQAPLNKPLRPKTSKNEQAAMVLVKKITGPGPSNKVSRGRSGPSATPVRFQSRIKKEDVQATDNGYASVQKLSAWLADGPCSNNKKMTTVRKGINVISKSRAFEKDLENIIIEENDIHKGSVFEKRNLFSNHGEMESDDDDKGSIVSVSAQKEWLQNAFQKVNSNDAAEGKCSEDLDQSEAQVKVSDRKKWLQTTFAKDPSSGVAAPPPPPPPPPPISRTTSHPVSKSSECVTNENKSTENITSTNDSAARLRELVKKRRAGLASSGSTVVGLSSFQKEKRNSHDSGTTTSATTSTLTLDALEKHNAVQNQWNRTFVDRRARSEACVDLHRDTRRIDNTNDNGNEEGDVDFKAARERLIQRSQMNGNPVNVWSKVQRKTQKFETINKEVKKTSGPMGRLKPTWEHSESSEAASTTYEKNFVEDIAPQKSFEELP